MGGDVVQAVIVDCFLWFREADMAELRLRMLDDLADVFVVAEANRTFQGRPKRFEFLDLLNGRLRGWRSRVLFWPVELPDGLVRWDAERFQREALQDGAREVQADVTVFSDVDEVWGGEMLEPWREGIHAARHDFRKMSVLWRWGAPYSWPGSIGGPTPLMLGQGWQGLRNQRWQLPSKPSGFHFSWMGEVDDIRVKAESFSHSEYADLPFEQFAAEGRWTDGALTEVECPPGIRPWLPESWLRRVP